MVVDKCKNEIYESQAYRFSGEMNNPTLLEDSFVWGGFINNKSKLLIE